ncbi:MAG TPA: ATP-binding cassette domain-containing protein, partial [Rhodospirillales bacterium]|nr:ATP-binding cassette domain-containing protein [Rhodospirillales bacterium]
MDGGKLVVDRVRMAFPRRRGEPVVALEEISLTVAEEEFVAIVGPSGCGKSTLLRLVAGLMEP